MDGVIPIDKPAGVTSHDVVDDVRRRLRTRRVGHAGTLDPDATGVLVVGVGKATRLLSYAQAQPKRYVATARFGVSTTTADASGDVVARRPAVFSEDELHEEAKRFVGRIQQLPPMVSAVKVGGERLYKKARRGEEVERAPRPVTIYELRVVDFRAGDEPEASLDLVCSAGTYVRSLVSDLGERLGCGAHVTALRRTAAGGFTEREAMPVSEVDSSSVLPMLEAVRFLPCVRVGPAAAAKVRNGAPLEAAARAPGEEIAEEESVAIACEGELLAIYARRGDRLRPRVVIPT